jgi:hypothetical protein
MLDSIPVNLYFMYGAYGISNFYFVVPDIFRTILHVETASMKTLTT